MRNLLKSKLIIGLVIFVTFFVSNSNIAFAEIKVIAQGVQQERPGSPGGALGEVRFDDSNGQYSVYQNGNNFDYNNFLNNQAEGYARSRNNSQNNEFLQKVYEGWHRNNGQDYEVIAGYVDDDGFIFDAKNDFVTFVKKSNGEISVIRYADTSTDSKEYTVEEALKANISTEVDDNVELKNILEKYKNDQNSAELENSLRQQRNFGSDNLEENVVDATAGRDVTKTAKQLESGGAAEVFGKWVDEAFQAIASFLLTLGSGLLYFSAIILNFIVYITILEIARFINLPAVETAWATFRDLANICFIFILLYISIQTIIKGSQFNTKELLGKVIFTAIILNFSLFCTKVVIDSSNILALSFYNKISATQHLSSGDVAASLDGGLATAFSSKLNLTSIYGVENSENIPKGAVQPLILGLFGFVLMTVVAIIFFTASIMLLTRLIMLTIYAITSPIAFMGAILPKTKSSITNKWWAGLIGQAFMAPVFFIFTWVTLSIIHSPSFSEFVRENENIKWVEIFTNKVELLAAAQFIFNYVLIIGLMIATIVATKKVASSSGQFATSVTKKIGGFATGAVFGTTAAVGRRTIGGVGEWVDKSGKFSGSNIFSRNIRGLSKRAAKSSFDARGSKGVASLFDQGGIAVKPGGKGGYRESAKKATDKTIDRISSMNPEAQNKYLGLDKDGNPTKWGGKHFGVGGRRVKDAVLKAREEDKTKWAAQDTVHATRLKEVENMPKGTEKLKRREEIRRLREKDLAERKKRDRTRVVDVVRSEKKNKAERDKAERERKIIEKLDEEEKAEKKKKKKEGEEENN